MGNKQTNLSQENLNALKKDTNCKKDFYFIYTLW